MSKLRSLYWDFFAGCLLNCPVPSDAPSPTLSRAATTRPVQLVVRLLVMHRPPVMILKMRLVVRIRAIPLVGAFTPIGTSLRHLLLHMRSLPGQQLSVLQFRSNRRPTPSFYLFQHLPVEDDIVIGIIGQMMAETQLPLQTVVTADFWAFDHFSVEEQEE